MCLRKLYRESNSITTQQIGIYLTSSWFLQQLRVLRGSKMYADVLKQLFYLYIYSCLLYLYKYNYYNHIPSVSMICVHLLCLLSCSIPASFSSISPFSVWQHFSHVLDIFGKPDRKFFETLSLFSKAPWIIQTYEQWTVMVNRIVE